MDTKLIIGSDALAWYTRTADALSLTKGQLYHAALDLYLEDPGLITDTQWRDASTATFYLSITGAAYDRLTAVQKRLNLAQPDDLLTAGVKRFYMKYHGMKPDALQALLGDQTPKKSEALIITQATRRRSRALRL